ncbi:MAG: NfeD family protein [Muribaculaceae bacterium]|nr:NfeD family protein [Muribaculaceae bacterium]
MSLWSLWLIIAIIFFVTELFSQSVWALCVALGALAAMICSMADLSVVWQGTSLVAVCLLAYIALLPWLKRVYMRNSRPIATGMDALIGRRGFLIEEVAPGRLGRVRIDGDNWQVRAAEEKISIPAGTEVKVLAYDSIILTVTPVK